MASAALTKAHERIASMQRSAAGRRLKAKSEQIEDTVVGALAGYFYGAIERRARTAMPTIAGLPPAFIYGVILAAMGTGVSGRTGRWMHSTADGLLAVSAYQQGVGKGYTISGEDDLEPF